MADKHDVPVTIFAVRLRQAMEDHGLSLNDLAKETNHSYEYVRRLIRGLNLPSPNLLKLLCQRFKWDLAEMQDTTTQDRFRKRNGPSGVIAQPRNPEIEPFEKGWHLLKPSQKAVLLEQLETFVENNRRWGAAGSR